MLLNWKRWINTNVIIVPMEVNRRLIDTSCVLVLNNNIFIHVASAK